MGMIRPNYNVIDGINFRAEAKRFTHKTMQKKHVIFPGVNSAIITLKSDTEMTTYFAYNGVFTLQ